MGSQVMGFQVLEEVSLSFFLPENYSLSLPRKERRDHKAPTKHVTKDKKVDSDIELQPRAKMNNQVTDFVSI